MSAVDLLPCPFCGGDDIGRVDGPPEDDWVAHVCCKCHASGPHNYSDKHAAASWNRRAPVSANQNYADPLSSAAPVSAGKVKATPLHEVRALWCKHGGRVRGPRVETWSMPEASIPAFLSALQPGDGWQGKADAMAAAIEAEADARAVYLATMPDRGGLHGPKGQRRAALEAAQTAAVMAAKAYRAPPASLPQGEETR